MRRSLRPRSRVFRSLLALALLAWTALSLDAFAHPIAMTDAMGFGASTTMGEAMPAHCDDMATAQTSHGSHSTSPHPAGTGHGCCAHGGCDCALLCSGIVDVRYRGPGHQSARDPALLPVRAASVSIRTAPPLRPPIA